MRLRNLKNKEEIMKNSKVLIENPEDFCGNWANVFGNSFPIHVEIGTGKGKFIESMAKCNPEINFIGIERYDSVIARALEKVDTIPNLRFIRMDAFLIDTIFNHEISRIYLNFSDPWPKVRHHKRRLTSEVFLQKYDGIFVGDGEILQKTDNQDLFLFSLCSLSQHGYHFSEIFLDLTKEAVKNLATTEYEMRFVEQGYPIYFLHAHKNKR